MPITILPIAIDSVGRFLAIPIGNTFIWWSIEALILLIFFFNTRYGNIDLDTKKVMFFVKLYLIWNVFSIIRGFFIAETYWDWKGLVGNAMALLLPIIAYTTSTKEGLQAILHFYVKYVLIVSILLLPIMPFGALGTFYLPISFLILFIPGLLPRGKVVIIVFALVGLFCDFTTRSYLFKYGIPIILLLTFYNFKLFSRLGRLMELTRLILMIVPILLFILAVSGVFNVFNMNSYIKEDYKTETTAADGTVIKADMTSDTRTGLYEEVLKSAQKHNYSIIGRSPARGNDTVLFASLDQITGRQERLRNEVGILNVFTWTGVIGVILYFFIFYRASYLAINKSNNIFSKLAGLFIAFHWLYSWVEDINMFGIDYFVIWLILGFCFSETFRRMDNIEIKLWLWGIFGKKYNRAYQVYLQSHSPKPII